MEFSFSKLGTPPCRHQWRHFCYNTDMKKVQPDDDLFAPADLRSDVYSGSEASVASESERFIDSPLVTETADWLGGKTKELGSLLSSDRAVEYVAILRAFVEFRQHHEPEPLHEDIARTVCGEASDPFAELMFKSDLRQLKDWGLVTERIEKERLRGYRDNRRTKFRYRLCEEAVQFVAWLEERRNRPLDAGGGDITGNLLDLQCSLLHELRRKLRTVTSTGMDVDTAGDVLYRVEQMRVYVDATARTLQALNLRLLSFGAESFSADEAKPVVDELAHFLEHFGRRFGVLREEIVQNLTELRRPNQAARWATCAEVLRTEASKFRHIASMRIPDATAILADSAQFYAPDGALVDLMQRIVDSARKVWGKLNAKLRELERRNHRLEDLGARIVELSKMDENVVPYDWFRRLLETAAMRGDAQIHPGGEKSVPPLPKASAKVKTRKVVTWITPRTVGEKADVASIAQVRGARLKDWLKTRTLYPEGAATRLSDLVPQTFEDFPNVVQLVEYMRLGRGEKGRRYLDVTAQELPESTMLVRAGCTLVCNDLVLTTAQKESEHED